MRHTLVEHNGRYVHPNWLRPAFAEVLKRAKQGRIVRAPRIVEPTLAHLRTTGR